MKYQRKRYSKKHQHYYSPKQTGRKKSYKFSARIHGITADFKTASGIFSPRRIDLGSMTLIKNMELMRKSRILDLGCGYGAIGIYAAKMCPTSKIVMIDINRRAVECAKSNIELNNVKNASAKQSYGFSSLKNQTFDVILFNPPQTAGLGVCFELLEESYEHLNKNGNLQIVVRRRKGGERFEEKLEELFGNVEVLGKKAGYWVYKSIKK